MEVLPWDKKKTLDIIIAEKKMELKSVIEIKITSL